MTQDDIVEFVKRELAGTQVFVASEDSGAPEVAWDDIFFFYDPDDSIPADKRFPYATIVVSDYPGFDEASDLAREDVFRVNVWVSKDTFQRETFGRDESSIDYTVLDEVIPHPVYGPQAWLSVLNPGSSTDGPVKTLLTEAHDRARARYEKRRSKGAAQS